MITLTFDSNNRSKQQTHQTEPRRRGIHCIRWQRFSFFVQYYEESLYLPSLHLDTWPTVIITHHRRLTAFTHDSLRKEIMPVPLRDPSNLNWPLTGYQDWTSWHDWTWPWTSTCKESWWRKWSECEKNVNLGDRGMIYSWFGRSVPRARVHLGVKAGKLCNSIMESKRGQHSLGDFFCWLGPLISKQIPVSATVARYGFPIAVYSN